MVSPRFLGAREIVFDLTDKTNFNYFLTRPFFLGAAFFLAAFFLAFFFAIEAYTSFLGLSSDRTYAIRLSLYNTLRVFA